MDLLDDLLVLIELTELGERVPAHGRALWAIDCARRAVSANIEILEGQATALRRILGLARATLDDPPAEARARLDALALELAGVQTIVHDRAAAATRRRPDHALACRAAEAVERALDCVAGDLGAELVAAAAREAFTEPRAEADAQIRRLLYWTKLLPSGVELLVRLDYAESRGRLPTDPDERAWLEERRGLLMSDDEQGRMQVTLRHLELVFLAELERIR